MSRHIQLILTVFLEGLVENKLRMKEAGDSKQTVAALGKLYK